MTMATIEVQIKRSVYPMLKSIFAKEEVNTGRQREFDYLKGFLMILIFIIHAFQGTLSPKDDVMRIIYIFNSMS